MHGICSLETYFRYFIKKNKKTNDTGILHVHIRRSLYEQRQKSCCLNIIEDIQLYSRHLVWKNKKTFTNADGKTIQSYGMSASN